MRRWLVPALLILLAVMLDTTVLPMFITSVWFVPLSLALVVCIGASQGRYYGMIFGLAAGLLIDILVGFPLGLRLFQYLGAGFLSGLIVHITEKSREQHAYRPAMFALRLGLFTLGYAALVETAVCVYQYFNTARFEPIYAINALVRVGLTTLLTLALYVPLMRLSLGENLHNTQASPRKKEARFY